MRPIKFRLFDEDSTIGMIYPGGILPNSGCESIFLGIGEENGKLAIIYEDKCESSAGIYCDEIDEAYHVMQFTGLKDKNGIEIYEGDLIKVMTPSGKEKICKITWSEFNAGFSCNAVDNSLFIGASGNLSREGEVIGNIYQNKELHNK